MLQLQRDRKYELVLGNPESGDALLIRDLQITFDVQLYAANNRTSNSAVVEVYNLSRESLGRLQDDFSYCSLSVGYRDTGIQTILTGNITKVATRRSGTDQITRLFLGESYAALHHTRVKSLVAPGKTAEEVIEEIRKQMPGVVRGAYVCEGLDKRLPYGYPLNGNPKAMLDRLCRERDWEYRVYLGALYVNDVNSLVNNTVDEAPLISQDTGLIDIPYYESAIPQELPTAPKRASGVRFTALLNPSVEPGRLVQLETTVMPNLSGLYRVLSIRYYGDYRGNDWYMEVSANQLDNLVVPR